MHALQHVLIHVRDVCVLAQARSLCTSTPQVPTGAVFMLCLDSTAPPSLQFLARFSLVVLTLRAMSGARNMQFADFVPADDL
jgi:hypothetical protein